MERKYSVNNSLRAGYIESVTGIQAEIEKDDRFGRLVFAFTFCDKVIQANKQYSKLLNDETTEIVEFSKLLVLEQKYSKMMRGARDAER